MNLHDLLVASNMQRLNVKNIPTAALRFYIMQIDQFPIV
jgi:hypothetical protein